MDSLSGSDPARNVASPGGGPEGGAELALRPATRLRPYRKLSRPGPVQIHPREGPALGTVAAMSPAPAADMSPRPHVPPPVVQAAAPDADPLAAPAATGSLGRSSAVRHKGGMVVVRTRN